MPFDPSAARPGSEPSNNPSYQSAFICYIDGLETPILGFDTEAGVWQIPQFRIYLLPDILVQRLGHEDRVQVQIFYWDGWYEPEKPSWRLLVDGEIIGWSYANYAGGRAVSFSCVANIHLFQQLYFHYMTNVDDVVASRAPDLVAQGFSTPGLIYPYALFHQGLLTTATDIETATARPNEAVTEEPPATAPIRAPYELLTNVVRGIISSEVPAERRAVPQVNFFARHVRRTRLNNRFVRLPILEDPAVIGAEEGVFPIFKAARNQQAMGALQRHMTGQYANAGPVWTTLEQTFQQVFMEIGMVPNPPAVLVQLNDTTGTGAPTDGRIIGSLREDTPVEDQRSPGPRVEDNAALGVSPLTPLRLAQYFVKPPANFAMAPSCNIIFPSMVDSWTFDESFIQQPTRTYVNDAVMTQLLRAEGPNREFMLHALSVAYPEEANALLHHRIATVGAGAATPTDSGRNLLIWPEEAYKGVVAQRFAIPPFFQYLRQFGNSQIVRPAPSTPNASPLIAPPVIAGEAPVPIAPGAAPMVPNIPLERRGGSTSVATATEAAIIARIPEFQDDYPYRWTPSARARTAGERANTTWEPTRYGDVGVDQVPPQPGTRYLRDYLYDHFPNFSRLESEDGHSRHVELSRSTRDPTRYDHYTSPNQTMDDHQAGRALDLCIPRVRRNGIARANLEVGNPIADWLVENAEMLGVAYLIWAGTTWHGGCFDRQRRNPRPTSGGQRRRRNPRPTSGGQRRGQPPAPAPTPPTLPAPAPPSTRFRRSAPEINSARPGFDVTRNHYDHIHVTLSRPGAAGTLPFYQRGGVTPVPARPVTVTSVPSRPIVGPTLPGSGLPTGVAAASGVVEARPEAAAEGDTFSQLFSLYAEYEHLRTRYQHRMAGAQLRFNPYLVAGFPGMIFDTMATRMHVVGHVQTVSHNGRITGAGATLGTSVQFSYCRTWPEFLSDVRADGVRFGARVLAAPAEIISQIREVLQDEQNAERFYRQLLHGGRHRAGGASFSAVFRWTKAMGFAEGTRTSHIEITGAAVADRARRDRAEEEVQRRAAQDVQVDTETDVLLQELRVVTDVTATSNLDPNAEYAPAENAYSQAFATYDIAMQLAARPCCSLEEYVRFWHGGKPIGTMMSAGQVAGEQNEWGYQLVTEGDIRTIRPPAGGPDQLAPGTRVRFSGVYYDQIFKSRVGPGPDGSLDELSDAQRGYTSPPAIHAPPATQGVPVSYPETRANWHYVLKLYREKVRHSIRPSL